VIEDIDPDTLAVRIAAWTTVVLDIREEARFRDGGIPDALCIPFGELPIGLRGLPVETPLAIVCQTGEESRAVAPLLWNLGYRKIAILKGGFASYVERGLPLTKR